MKKLFIITIILLGAHSLTVAQNGVLANGKEYTAHAKGWMVDINKAYEVSNKTGKPILANFTGSDWCGWCVKLKAEVFDTPEFKVWAAKNVVLIELDSPHRFKLPEAIQQQNASLVQAFKVSKYPTIWVFNLTKNADNKYNIEALGKTGYVKGTKTFTDGVDAMILQAKEAKKKVKN